MSSSNASDDALQAGSYGGAVSIGVERHLNDVVITRTLTRRFRHVVAVDAVNLAVLPGELFGLLGRNGAGQTTLIRMLTTLVRPSSGTATVAAFGIESDLTRVRS